MVKEGILKSVKKGNKLLAILIDPDKFDERRYKLDSLNNADLIFVGGSTVNNGDTEKCCNSLKEHTNTPLIIFPGDASQITVKADAMLFTSLLSGRNSEYLIEQQIEGAKKIIEFDLETISCSYIVISTGKETSVERVSRTNGISVNDINQIIYTAKAGELMGMSSCYLEAGSGADHPIPAEVIEQVKKHVKSILIVGGGIRSEDQKQKAWDAGADIVVMGTVYEEM